MVLCARRYFQRVKKTYPIVLLLLAVVAPATGQEAEPWLLNFEEASERAIAQNPLVEATLEEITAAEKGLQAAWGKYVPKIPTTQY